ncbi:MAG: PIN domain-containing protein, partial [Candidatus Bathyarchaeia archaeon]
MKSTAKKKQPLKVIIDSNALFIPFQFKIDIYNELKQLLNRNFELILISPVKRELEKLAADGPPKMRKNASLALKFADECSYVEVERTSQEATDDLIVKVAGEWKAPVFTNDKLLRKRLRDINVPVIYM